MMLRNLLAASLLAALLVACGGGGSGTDLGPDEDLPPVALPDIPANEAGQRDLVDATPDERPEATDPGKDLHQDLGHEAIADPGEDPAGEATDEAPTDDGLAGDPDPGPTDPGPPDPGAPDVPCAAPCEEGSICVQGTCMPCNTDLRCGTTCRPCSGKTIHCLEGVCIQCLSDVECALDSFCSSNTCKKCSDIDDPNHCGRTCDVCGGEAPTCSGGLCACTAGSCKTGRHCVDIACLPCNVSDACGTACTPCDPDHPFCVAGARCAACRDDNDCGTGLQCHNDACVPECRPPVEACTTDATPGGAGCGAAVRLGRATATATITDYDYLLYAHANSDDTSGACPGDGPDKTYSVWLAKGESIDVTGIPDLDPNNSTYPDLVLKLYTGTVCAPGGGTPRTCVDAGGAGAVETLSFTADAAGWYSLVVDSTNAYYGDYGYFYLQVTLHSLRSDACCGP